MASLDLNKAFFSSDAQRATETFERLAQHLSSFFITGGVASSYYFLQHGYPLSIRQLSDLDIVITHPDDLSSSVTKDFLICHYHPVNRKGKFHIVLMDKKTGVRIDVFPLRSKANERTQAVQIDGHEYQLLSAEDVTCRLLGTCHMVMDNKPIDPKYLITMISLYGLCDRKQIENIWTEYSDEGETFAEMYLAVTNKIKQEPKLLEKFEFQPELNVRCEKCEDVEGFELAGVEEVKKVIESSTKS